jgi:hypothetical protein
VVAPLPSLMLSPPLEPQAQISESGKTSVQQALGSLMFGFLSSRTLQWDSGASFYDAQLQESFREGAGPIQNGAGPDHQVRAVIQFVRIACARFTSFAYTDQRGGGGGTQHPVTQ